MTITTYAGLKAAISTFLNREDLADAAPTFIALAEAGLNRDVRHWAMETRASAVFDSQYENLPRDWLGMVRVSIVGDKGIDPASQATIMDMREGNSQAGKPQLYTITGGDIELFPTPDTAYDGEILYYSKIPSLCDSCQTNWLLDFAPDAYLYGALLHSAPYLAEDARLSVWSALYQSAVDKLNESSERGKHGGVGMVMRMARKG
jgi:hypothetical protein